jgi:hypothetical protein
MSPVDMDIDIGVNFLASNSKVSETRTSKAVGS